MTDATGQADLHQFLEIARQMDAPIVGPTFASPLIETEFVAMRKMEKIDVLRSWNQFCWLIVC